MAKAMAELTPDEQCRLCKRLIRAGYSGLIGAALEVTDEAQRGNLLTASDYLRALKVEVNAVMDMRDEAT